MSFPLGWNSIDDATWWHDVFWWLGIACLVLLAVSEIAAKRYGDRKDELIAAAADQQAQEQRTEEAQRAAEAEALQKKLSDAGQRTAQVEADLAKAREERLPRSLTRDQQEK